jgi:mRNA-degrading endonuclease RelE of RelBE toxin-antitoxin system
MPGTQPFEIVFDERALEHLDVIESKYDSVIRHALEAQLRMVPYVETRNRKPLRAPTTLGATWELRCSPRNRFRIFYDIDLDARVVIVLAIAVKNRNEVWIGQERLEL